MKKFLALALGLVLVGTTVISLSDASRDAYHAYLYQQALKQGTERRFAAGQKVRVNKNVQKKEYTGRPAIQNLRYTQSKRDIFRAGNENSSELKFRPMSNTVGFAVAQSAREKLTIKNLDSTDMLVQTVVTDDFSVELPMGWNPIIEDGVLSVGDEQAFAVTIRRVEGICENVSFESCAMNVSNNLNHLENIGTKINSLGHVARLRQRTDRTLGTNEYTNTHTESFLGIYLGRDVFVTRYFVEEPETSNLFLIETIADRQWASEAVVVAKRLAYSFRMIPAVQE